MKTDYDIRAIDLFCGAGGLTSGLEKAGISVNAGIDIDPACEYPYGENNNSQFIQKSVKETSGIELKSLWQNARFKLLAGCAPCQPFSSYRQGMTKKADGRWTLLNHFSRLVTEANPDLVTMENVSGLLKHQVFIDFINTLESQGFYTNYKVVNCLSYGVAQGRQRLVLMASKYGPIELISPTHNVGQYRTVRDEIYSLPPLKAGEINVRDSLHQACSLSELNMKRMVASSPGGTWRDWHDDLIADCHKKSTGKTYSSVYGRMSWDQPAPTITTQFFGFGNGRFGHPAQDRALSLREGAILQGFSRDYKFVSHGESIYRKTIGRLIGNAVPVRLGEVIGRSIIQHIKSIIVDLR